ncbi:MAG: ATP-binding protein [Pseudomonadota bacterium]
MIKQDLIRNRLKNATTAITVRLRLALMAVALTVSIATGLGLMQARNIIAAHQELNHHATPLLSLVRQLEAELTQFDLLLNDLPQQAVETSARLGKNTVQDHAARKQDLLSRLESFDVPADVVQTLDTSLSTARTLTLAILEDSQSFLAGERQTAHALQNAKNLTHDLKETLTKLSTAPFSWPVAREVLPHHSVVDPVARTGASPLNASPQFDEALTPLTTSLALILAASQAIGTRGGSEPDATNTSNAINHLLWRVQQRSLIIDEAARALIVTQLSELQQVLHGRDGLLSLQHRQYALQQDIAQHRVTYNALMAGMETPINAMIAHSEQKVNRASQHLTQAISALVCVLTGAFAFSAGLVFLANRWIVEKQFRSRIQEINSAVRAIAAGDLEQPIPVSGKDELGDMATALRVFKQNAEHLQTSNLQLEKFAYVAAHDLRAPLRAIHDLANWTLEDAQDQLPADSRTYLKLLQERATRMDRLLRDLLCFARVGTQNPKPQTIALAHFVKEQAECIDPQGSYRIQYIGKDHEITLALTPLQQILSNLLSNAVRHHDKHRGRISVSAKVSSKALTLCVADDGPGIDLKYQRRIFELFQTLQSQDTTEGSGIGLSIVRKVVDAQKGTIILQSDPTKQRGTRFEITLPLAEKRQETWMPDAA